MSKPTIAEIKRLTNKKRPQFFTAKTLAFYGQRLRDFKVFKVIIVPTVQIEKATLLPQKGIRHFEKWGIIARINYITNYQQIVESFRVEHEEIKIGDRGEIPQLSRNWWTMRMYNEITQDLDFCSALEENELISQYVLQMLKKEGKQK